MTGIAFECINVRGVVDGILRKRGGERMNLRRGKLREDTQAMVESLEGEIQQREVELEVLKKELKMMRNKLEEQERR
jgi:hypothetical protein